MTTKLAIIVLLCLTIIIVETNANRRGSDITLTDESLSDETEDEPDEDGKTNDPDDEEKRLMLDVFLHNFIYKIQRAVLMLDDEKLAKKFEELNEEYQERLVEDTIHTQSGFLMGDQALLMLRLANYVLDRADMREMRNKRLFKTNFSNKKGQDAKLTEESPNKFVEEVRPTQAPEQEDQVTEASETTIPTNEEMNQTTESSIQSTKVETQSNEPTNEITEATNQDQSTDTPEIQTNSQTDPEIQTEDPNVDTTASDTLLDKQEESQSEAPQSDDPNQEFQSDDPNQEQEVQADDPNQEQEVQSDAPKLEVTLSNGPKKKPSWSDITNGDFNRRLDSSADDDEELQKGKRSKSKKSKKRKSSRPEGSAPLYAEDEVSRRRSLRRSALPTQAFNSNLNAVDMRGKQIIMVRNGIDEALKKVKDIEDLRDNVHKRRNRNGPRFR